MRIDHVLSDSKRMRQVMLQLERLYRQIVKKWDRLGNVTARIEY
ncbi:hypothetical protein HanXRQr2_Chr02g0083891 [Helianthus annuus]|uniref:Uncharacterized protein n=1 Tax=Helianthus annuus TaxID=4232 RepID=A0A9K3P0Y3_HELAN|nr:hypothetical protein HanXRQr2_Chr02g0083891 [Helianthus annuus]KAJ0953210.1 hypothetical protein HanPSC8_Chr02g0081281 [Helianthus annuus]